MILETGCRSIVMVTGLIEKGRSKCAKYWPEAPTALDIAGISVENIGTVRQNGFLISDLVVTLGSDIRTVRHFWYDSWPDHGVPDKTEPLLGLMQFAQDWDGSTEVLGRPWTVHCSAGIGRTGAFLAIDLGVRTMEQGEEVNVIDIIRWAGRCDGLGLRLDPWAAAGVLLLLSNVCCRCDLWRARLVCSINCTTRSGGRVRDFGRCLGCGRLDLLPIQ